MIITANGTSPALKLVAPMAPRAPRSLPVLPPPAKGLSTRNIVAVGLIACFGFFGGFVVWAVMAPLKSAVLADGYAKIPGYRKKVQHLEGGIIESVNVKDGDHVKANQVLAKIENKNAISQRSLLQSQLMSNLALNARLSAEQKWSKSIKFPDEVLASKDDATAQHVEAQRQVFEARRTAYVGSLALKDQKTGQIKEQIAGGVAQRVAYDKQIKLIGEEVSDQSELWDKKLTRKSQLSTLRRQMAQLEAEQGKTISEIARNNAAIAEVEEDKLQAKRKLLEDIALERKTVEDTIFDLRQKLISVNDVIDRLEIRAVADGIVVGLTVNGAGAVVGPRETVLEIVPVVKTLTIEANVRPSDIDAVHEGQTAEVQLLTTAARRSAKLRGKVVHVSADRLADEKNKSFYYKIDVELSADDVLPKGQTITLYPGMPAEVFIETGARSLARYLLAPIYDSFNRGIRER